MARFDIKELENEVYTCVCGCLSLSCDSNRKKSKSRIHFHMQKLICSCQCDMITFSQRCQMSADGGDVPNKTKPAKTIDQ